MFLLRRPKQDFDVEFFRQKLTGEYFCVSLCVRTQYTLKVLPFRTGMTLKDIKILSTKGNVKLYQGSNCRGRELDSVKGDLHHYKVRLARNSVHFTFTAIEPMRCSL